MNYNFDMFFLINCTFINDTHIQLSWSLRFYLLCLLLNTCDRNCAFWRHSVLVKQSTYFSREHRILSLKVCGRQNVQLTPKRGWLQNLATDAGMYIVQDTSVTPATWCSASTTHRQACQKTSKIGQLRKWLCAGHHFENLQNTLPGILLHPYTPNTPPNLDAHPSIPKSTNTP